MHRTALITLFVAGEALAHPDHDTGGWLSASLSHLLSEPDHLAMILAPLVIGVVLIALLRAKRRRGVRIDARDRESA